MNEKIDKKTYEYVMNIIDSINIVNGLIIPKAAKENLKNNLTYSKDKINGRSND